MKIFAVKSTDIDATWPGVLPTLEKVLDYNWGFYSMGDIKDSLVAGASLLICVKDGEDLLACIVCVQEPHPARKVLHMPVVCGERMDEWLDLSYDTIPRIARELGFDMLMSKGRKGWTRKLQKYGFKEMYTTLGLDL